MFALCKWGRKSCKGILNVVLCYREIYCVKDNSDAPQNYSDADVIKMPLHLIGNIFVEFGGIPMGTNCAPLLADLFLYSYEAESVCNLTF